MPAASAARVLQALKNTSIEGVSGRLRLDPQTGDRRWLLEVKNIVCLQGDDASSERQLSSGEGYCAAVQARTVLVQDETGQRIAPAGGAYSVACGVWRSAARRRVAVGAVEMRGPIAEHTQPPPESRVQLLNSNCQ